ncbi:MAG: hypothetical protein P8X64_09360 [Anaerolineales bacterium]|jgi:hypothetical protein
MPSEILATKFFILFIRPWFLRRAWLIERLKTGLPRMLTMISASAGLISHWNRLEQLGC